MTRDGVEYTCDKCGKTMFAPTDMCSTMNSVRERMTRDWEEDRKSTRLNSSH